MKRFLVLAVSVALLAGAAYYMLQGETRPDTSDSGPPDSVSWGKTMDFDPETWKDEGKYYEEPYPRRDMVKSLTEDHLKAGMTKASVLELLGAPTETPKFQDHDLVYWLGPESGFVSVDSSWLVIDLDQEEQVEKFSVVSD